MQEPTAVEFRSEEDDRATLRLAYQAADPDVGSFDVEIKAGGLSCVHGALSLNGDGLDAFLADLATDWRGWDGTRTWAALEQGISIEATHHGGRVELLFIVRRDEKPDAWEVRFPVLVAPGESLSRLARASADLLDVG